MARLRSKKYYRTEKGHKKKTTRNRARYDKRLQNEFDKYPVKKCSYDPDKQIIAYLLVILSATWNKKAEISYIKYLLKIVRSQGLIKGRKNCKYAHYGRKNRKNNRN